MSVRIRAARRLQRRRPRLRRARAAARARRGFGLIELLVSMIVLSVGMLGLAGLMASALRRDRVSTSRSEVVSVAESKLEELRSYAQLPSTDPLRARLATGGSLTANVTNYTDSTLALNGRWYYRRWQISDGAAVGTRRITLRVTPQTRLRYDTPSLDFTTLMVLL